MTQLVCLRAGLVIAWTLLAGFSVPYHYARPGDFARVTKRATSCVQSSTSTSKDQGIKKSSTAASDVLERTFSFRGWIGESAVVRKEELLKDGGIRTSFFLLKPNRSWIRLSLRTKREDGHNDPPGLQKGRILISDHVRKSEQPRIVFVLEADPKQITALQESISESALAKPVNAVRATLKIIMESGKGKRVILWKQTRVITSTVGESGMVYRPPDLRSAILSPHESVLLVELIVNEASEYFVLAMKPFRFH